MAPKKEKIKEIKKHKFWDFFKDSPSDIKLIASVGVLIEACLLAILPLLPESERINYVTENTNLIKIYLIGLLIYLLIRMLQLKNNIKPQYVGGITNYFHSRGDAQQEIMSVIKRAENEIFLAGIALSSLSSIFKTEHVIEYLKGKSDFLFTVIILLPNSGDVFVVRDNEIQQRNLKNVLMGSLEYLIPLKKELSSSNNITVEFRFYKSIMPRHFILKADDQLRVGSYFSNKEGGASYLLTLENIGNDSLYHMFNREIKHIKANSILFDFDENDNIVELAKKHVPRRRLNEPK